MVLVEVRIKRVRVEINESQYRIAEPLD